MSSRSTSFSIIVAASRAKTSAILPVLVRVRGCRQRLALDDVVLVGEVGHAHAEVVAARLHFQPPSLLMQQVPSMTLSKTAVMPERARPVEAGGLAAVRMYWRAGRVQVLGEDLKGGHAAR